MCFVIFKYHLNGILTVFECISNNQTKKTENDGTFFGADHSRQSCRPSSAMLPTIVGNAADHRQHQNKHSRKL